MHNIKRHSGNGVIVVYQFLAFLSSREPFVQHIILTLRVQPSLQGLISREVRTTLLFDTLIVLVHSDWIAPAVCQRHYSFDYQPHSITLGG